MTHYVMFLCGDIDTILTECTVNGFDATLCESVGTYNGQREENSVRLDIVSDRERSDVRRLVAHLAATCGQESILLITAEPRETELVYAV